MDGMVLVVVVEVAKGHGVIWHGAGAGGGGGGGGGG